MGSTDGCGTKHWCSVDHVQTRNRPWPYCKSFLPSLYWFLESWAVHLGLLGHFWIVYKYTMGGPVWLVFVYLSFHFQLIKVSNFRAFSCPVSSGLWRRDFFFSFDSPCSLFICFPHLTDRQLQWILLWKFPSKQGLEAKNVYRTLDWLVSVCNY